MKSFVIHEIKKKLKLSDVISLDGGFKYVLKSSNLGVKEIIILDPHIIDQLILANFNRRYKKILEYYIATLQNKPIFYFVKKIIKYLFGLLSLAKAKRTIVYK